MSNYPAYLIESPFCANGDKTIPPLTALDAGDGHFSQQEGFGVLNSTPIEDGGIPPYRGDMNGALFLISQLLFWYQQGGVMRWNSTLTYESGNEVIHNGVKYRCKQQCKNIAPPNKTYWHNVDVTVPAGAVVPFANVSVNSAGNPTFWGDSTPDTGWILCDGRATGITGVNTPNLVNRCIRGSTPANSGQTGGADSVTLAVSNLPSHSHGASVTEAGDHTHTRGTMDITGKTGTCSYGAGPTASGGFFKYGTDWGAASTDRGNQVIEFQASRSWEGETSQNGAHSHSVTIGSTGSGTAVDIKPRFYTLAYFMRLPE